MKIERTPKQTPDAPQSSPAAGSRQSAPGDLERRVWEELAPRLLHPTKLAFIQLLLAAGEPLSLEELAEAVTIDRGHAEHHCKRMEMAGVLEVVSAEGEGEEPSYFFPKAAEPATASSAAPGGH